MTSHDYRIRPTDADAARIREYVSTELAKLGFQLVQGPLGRKPGDPFADRYVIRDGQGAIVAGDVYGMELREAGYWLRRRLEEQSA